MKIQVKLLGFMRSLSAYVLFAVGTAFIVFAWLLSYPVTIPSLDKHVFDLISPFLWVGVSMVLASLLLISECARGRMTKLFCATSMVFFIYVHYLFFERLPGPDSHKFRAMTMLSQIAGVSPDQTEYFQWPSFFIFNDVIAEVTGFGVNNISALVFIATGFALSAILFLYSSDESEGMGFAGVALYFAGLFYFVNYQFAPQSIALVLLLACVKLVARNNLGSKICALLVFVGLVFTHAFMPVMFLGFYLIMVLLRRGRIQSLALYSAVYVAKLVYAAVFHVHDLIMILATLPGELQLSPDYEDILYATFGQVHTQIDAVAQIFSRAVTLSIWLLLMTGLLIRVARSDFGIRNLSLMLSGLLYSAIGMAVSIIGYRGFQLAFVPFVSCCKPYLTRYRKLVIGFLLVVLMLFPFVIVHQIYDTPLVQTASGERASETLIPSISGGSVSILASRVDACYIFLRMSAGQRADLPIVPLDSPLLLSRKYDYVVYGHSLEKRIASASDLRAPEMDGFVKNYSRIWDDGSSRILFAGSSAPYFQYFPSC